MKSKLNWTDRRWLAIVFVRQLLIAWLFFVDQERYTLGANFVVALKVFPIIVWSAVFLVAAIPAGIALATARMNWARAAIIASLVLSVYWTFALVFARAEFRTTSWLLAVIWGALMMKDANLAFSGLGVRRQRPGI